MVSPAPSLSKAEPLGFCTPPSLPLEDAGDAEGIGLGSGSSGLNWLSQFSWAASKLQIAQMPQCFMVLMCELKVGKSIEI